jgi:hypothetical protein
LIPFKTHERLKDERVVLSVNKKVSGEDPAVQLDLPISVNVRLWKSVCVGIVVGFLLAVPQITSARINRALRAEASIGWPGSFIAVVNLAVGVEAALNSRKPL